MRAGDSGDVVERVGLADVARGTTDDDRDLALVVGLGDVLRNHDRVAVADEGARRLGEQGWRGGHEYRICPVGLV